MCFHFFRLRRRHFTSFQQIRFLRHPLSAFRRHRACTSQGGVYRVACVDPFSPVKDGRKCNDGRERRITERDEELLDIPVDRDEDDEGSKVVCKNALNLVELTTQLEIRDETEADGVMVVTEELPLLGRKSQELVNEGSERTTRSWRQRSLSDGSMFRRQGNVQRLLKIDPEEPISRCSTVMEASPAENIHTPGRPAYHRSQSEDSYLRSPRLRDEDLKMKLVSERLKNLWEVPEDSKPRAYAGFRVGRSVSEPSCVAINEERARYDAVTSLPEKQDARVQLSLIYDPSVEVLHVVVHQIQYSHRGDGNVELQVSLFPNSASSKSTRTSSRSVMRFTHEEFSFNDVKAPLDLERAVLKIRLLTSSQRSRHSSAETMQDQKLADNKPRGKGYLSKRKRIMSDSNISRVLAQKIGLPKGKGQRRLYSESDLRRSFEFSSLSTLHESQSFVTNDSISEGSFTDETSTLEHDEGNRGTKEGREPYAEKVKRGQVHSLLLGEGVLELGRFCWSKGALIHHSDITLAKTRPTIKRSTPEKHLEQGLGDVFLTIQNQSYSSRVRVFVAYAKSLPRSDKLVGNPGHYLVVKFLHGSDVISENRTKTRTGDCPSWNEPFLFSLPQTEELDSYSLQLLLMRQRHGSSDSVIGHVSIGANQIHNGARHWREVCGRPGREVARWHSVLPVFTYTP